MYARKKWARICKYICVSKHYKTYKVYAAYRLYIYRFILFKRNLCFLLFIFAYLSLVTSIYITFSIRILLATKYNIFACLKSDTHTAKCVEVVVFRIFLSITDFLKSSTMTDWLGWIAWCWATECLVSVLSFYASRYDSRRYFIYFLVCIYVSRLFTIRFIDLNDIKANIFRAIV